MTIRGDRGDHPEPVLPVVPVSDPLAEVERTVRELLRAVNDGRYRYEEVHVRADLNYLLSVTQQARTTARRPASGGTPCTCGLEQARGALEAGTSTRHGAGCPASGDTLTDSERDVAILTAIKAVRDAAADERAELHDQGEPLTDYGSGVLDGLDKAWLAGRRAAKRPDDTRTTTSIEEWWACDDAYEKGLARAAALATDPEGQS